MKNRYAGFSAMEMMVVVAIIAILAMIAIPSQRADCSGMESHKNVASR